MPRIRALPSDRAATASDLRGRCVAVTGGARGIGYETAAALAAAGARVVLGDLDGTSALDAAARVGRGTVGLPLDVTDTASFEAFLDDVERLRGPLDVLVNNAGVMWVGPFDAEPTDAVTRQLEVNVGGVIRGTRLAVARMSGRGGMVVTIASAASRLAPPGQATYAATKHAVHGWLDAVRAELRGTGIEICLVLPGVVETELAVGTGSGAVRRLHPREVADAVVRVVRRPRFETVLPRRIGLLHRASGVLSGRARDALLRLTLPDQVAAVGDGAARHRYQSDRFATGSRP